MGRNRRDEDRDSKRAAIVNAAAELFARDGYESTAVTAISSAAGIAPNTIYWYFKNKDELLLAAFAAAHRAAPRSAEPPADLAEELLAITNGFDPVKRLVAAIHSRAELSPEVAARHAAYHARSDAWLRDRARAHILEATGSEPTDAELAAVPQIWTYAIEGMVVHGVPQAERREICAALVRQLPGVRETAAVTRTP